MQVNVTNIHAGELYMSACDPDEDNNIYKDAINNGTKMALTDVS